MLGRQKIVVLCIIFTIHTIHQTEGVVGVGLVYALTPGAAVGGLVTGIIGVILGGVSISVALDKLDLTGDKKKEEEEEEKEETGTNSYYNYPQQGYYNQEDGYHRGRRSRRGLFDDAHENLTEERVQLESFLDEVYLQDTSQCLEKLICTIAKRKAQEEPIDQEEKDIMKVIQHNVLHGYMYKKMLVSQQIGRAGYDCEFLYSSCSLPASKMLIYIRDSSRRIKGLMP